MADSQGKLRADGGRRLPFSAAAFVVGLCAGLIVAQLGYVAWHAGSSTSSSGSLRMRSLTATSSNTVSISGASSNSNLSSSPLAQTLQKVAPGKEVLVAISNFRLVEGNMLPMWLETVKQAQVSNYVVVALDEQLREWLIANNWNCFYKPLQISKAQQGTGDNHGISALKFKILEGFLELGWSVLLSDVDVAVLKNPFEHLYRDHDVEGMSDGFDAPTAYGHGNGIDDPSMGWSRYAQGTTHMHMNSGLFYLRANLYTINLMRRIAARLEKEKSWDQSVYNEEMFFLSHGDYVAANVDVRVMDIFQFMNTKILFKVWRHLPKAQQKMPVMVHINYHPDKEARLRAVINYFLNGDKEALAKFPGGSEPGS